MPYMQKCTTPHAIMAARNCDASPMPEVASCLLAASAFAAFYADLTAHPAPHLRFLGVAR